MTPAKTIQHLAAVAVGLFTMLAAVMLLLVPDLTNAVRTAAFLLSGAVVLHMLSRPDPPARPDRERLRQAFTQAFPELQADPEFAGRLADVATAAQDRR